MAEVGKTGPFWMCHYDKERVVRVYALVRKCGQGVPERIPCSCLPCSECSEWQKWVRPDPFGCVTMTRKEWSEYMSWLGNVGKEFLNKLVQAVLRILQFSSFTLKSIDSNIESLRTIHREFYGPEEKVVDYFTRKP